ncbi:unnamed protein product [Brachionus calyciflorus]|uniref:N-acyl-aliphatic-L-amino acid amidohydrolase n=1 Tax=Brachionus calyciflorus TaxID=104777 RepID=A0A813XX32_9BILA|nr:unnamed protein product [Brachionus calyciflorus]
MNRAVEKLIEYLRIKSVHPNPDYASAIRFIKNYAEEIGFDSYKEVEVHPNRIVCILSYYGTQPEKQSILLNSHTDVVPADPNYWKCDPFEGYMDDKGDIYARGVQDMKSVGIQHLEIIRKMKENNVRPLRTIHLTFVPDEEIGGVTGFLPFMDTQEFKDLNIGIALDEGQASPDNEFCVYYGERLSWWLYLTCAGNTGHGSRFIEKTAAEKLNRLLNKFLEYREQQKAKFKSECSCLKLGDITSVNLTTVNGGLARNIVPAEFKVIFDIRVTPKDTILTEFTQMVESWIAEAEGDDGDSGKITYHFENKRDEFALTSIDEEKNPWWRTLNNSCKLLGIKISEEIFPGGTDSRFLRERGIPAFGFTPLNNTPILLHDHNEFINKDSFLKGIDILYQVVLDLANMA